ncbi:MAG TPA: histidine kinase dimerization/phospho-acceptor domain-containing protein [Methylomirabilota bacterium]|jgi:signal transduction histidine kinase|nr:histidine kinase dimerization/phospho-acceptor domain-containing protein [Methylomirabilota bacterium]
MATPDFFHTLRNKLTVLKGNLDLIRLEDLPEPSQKMLRNAKSEINDINKLVEESEPS